MIINGSSRMLFRPAWATVDLDALAHNYSVLKNHIPPEIGIMAMVKADAYGHGAVAVSRVLEEAGVRSLGVATVEEGVELRDAGIKVSILVMCGLMGEGSPASKRMIEADLTPVIHSSGALDSLEQAATNAGRSVDVHLKIDSGMSRLGVRPEALGPVLKRLKDSPHIRVEGVMTHLADAGEEETCNKQMQEFIPCKGVIENELGPIKIWHVANSSALLRGWPLEVEGAGECWARPGLALFGECDLDHPLRSKIKPVMGIESRVMLLKTVPAGTGVSYGCTFTTKRKTRLGVVPIGYADGYPWSASGKAQVLIRGEWAPVVGRVTMDMIMIDVTDVQGVSVGDEVVLLGPQQEATITVGELAKWAGTIPYEILCRVSKRMPRIYIGEKG
ncbi:MAG: alanine racemase [Pseudomonadota bacterium]